MDGDMWRGRLSPICTWRRCPLRLCCWVFSLRLAISSHRLMYPDKLDLIHRLLSSIYFATGLCHLIDIRTEWWYQMSHGADKSWEDWNVVWCKERYFTAVWIMNTVLYKYPSASLEVVCFHPVCCVALLIPELLGHSQSVPGDQLFWCGLSWVQAYYTSHKTTLRWAF